MLVQRIMEFIKTLEKEDKPISCDVELRRSLFAHFSQKSTEESLTSDDIEFLVVCYKSRWAAIVDGENDYTRNPTVVNQHWIDLARELESLAKKNYLKILIPTLTNDRDLNDLSSLNETVNLFNFYLGYGGTTLFRKRSLCEHLKTWQFALSTYRSITERKLNVVTVDELARLKLCKQIERQVVVGTENFANFWDFMRKKIFIHLGDQGQIPIGLLPHLLELVDRYYYLRSTGADFSAFKNDLRNFFRRLYGYDLADVNSMYGAKIKYKDKEEYLLDLFIALHTANDFFELDFEIRALSKWLFQYNPALRSLSKELESIYNEMPKESSLVENAGGQSEALANCCRLLISLFTTHFESSIFFTGQIYSLWDKSNTVFREASDIFTILLPLIVANRPEALAEVYGDIIEDIIVPTRRDSSLYTLFTRNKPTIKWLECVQNCKLSELGAYWFEPELLFSALLHFNTNNQVVRSRVNVFLDDLIHTYAQDQNDLMKQLRVNILFAEFIDDLSDHHRRSLLILIKLCDLKTEKSKFLNNCNMYINDRLSQLCQAPLEGVSPLFFSSVRKLDSEKLFKFSEKIKDVGTMITEYKTQLLALKLEPKTSEKISAYLLKIGQPILTVAQKEMAKNSGRTLDYIGQYT